ncbi:isochorismatase [Cupriavidus sp. D39]|nr:isochorismatase [Cupriavidus sp. D39]
MNQSIIRTNSTNSTTRVNPYTVSVYPIQQEPGVWFATYLIAEYKNGSECIVANVSMRHATHGTEALAKQAARRAAESVAADMRLQ